MDVLLHVEDGRRKRPNTDNRGTYVQDGWRPSLSGSPFEDFFTSRIRRNSYGHRNIQGIDDGWECATRVQAQIQHLSHSMHFLFPHLQFTITHLNTVPTTKLRTPPSFYLYSYGATCLIATRITFERLGIEFFFLFLATRRKVDLQIIHTWNFCRTYPQVPTP
jgi:hypothetical protein